MHWLEPVDIYCERIGTAFWAEPLNAGSNAAFVIGAVVAWRTARKLGVRTPDLSLLLILAGLIGVGSFLFHSFANRWSELADTLPIWTFVGCFILVAMHRVGGVRPGRAAIISVAVAAILTVALLATGEGETAVAIGPDPLNGSGQYAPAVVALLIFSLLSKVRGNPMWPWIWAATGTFLLSLTLRTVDVALCQIWPIGTHFGWHLLNALMIWLLLDGIIRLQARSAVLTK